MRTSLIVAADENDVIGRDNALPWHLPVDLARFKRLTMGHALVAGRHTHESILDRLGKPLPGRFTAVVTGKPDYAAGAGAASQPSCRSALGLARSVEAFAQRDEVFVIGGAQVYGQLLDDVDRVYLTRVHQHLDDGDVAMPAGWLGAFELTGGEESGDSRCSFLTYDRR
ncbi:dihydrofolate reductase [Actinokineospora spheciospongiae]|uniref:dihydrofolate reductase n=1 Tax=Actinokineospora spheciospongiae TaxID=909613 RepID=UPI00055207A5|nr:dihydrofolate reductase [Actinokineospora spheciospongiae]PWW62793.1 dihydrofolate reductase [Actinokineospora spheciospongiae]